MPRWNLSAKERFETKYIPVTESGCWIWLASVDAGGYGRFRINGHVRFAHRHSWTLTQGTIPSGLCVLHRCDIPACVNPYHLYLGTRKDNADDRDKKQRGGSQKGEKHSSSKLNEADVIKIRSDRRTQRVIAKDYHVSRAAIALIKCHITWKHLL